MTYQLTWRSSSMQEMSESAIASALKPHHEATKRQPAEPTSFK